MATTRMRFKVMDRHTGQVVRPYRDHHHAQWAALKLCDEMASPKRYYVQAIG